MFLFVNVVEVRYLRLTLFIESILTEVDAAVVRRRRLFRHGFAC